MDLFLSAMGLFVAVEGIRFTVLFFKNRGDDSEETKPSTSDFTCPYCTIVVTGARQLDLINHVACITKSQADIEEMKSKANAVTGDEYLHTIRKLVATYKEKESHSNSAAWAYTGYDEYSTFEGTLWRNGEAVDTCFTQTKGACETLLKTRQQLDEFKRRHRRK